MYWLGFDKLYVVFSGFPSVVHCAERVWCKYRYDVPLPNIYNTDGDSASSYTALLRCCLSYIYHGSLKLAISKP